MPTNRALFLIDGSSLFASITDLRRRRPEFDGRKVQLDVLSNCLLQTWIGYTNETLRISYYFKKNDTRIPGLLRLPDMKIPRAKSHWEVIECGEPVSSIPDNELQKLSEKWRDSYARAEKGLDMRLACDALTMAAMGRISDFVFYLNDRDYLPLFDSLKRLGCCVYLTSLDMSAPNSKLIDACDLYQNLDDNLDTVFETV